MKNKISFSFLKKKRSFLLLLLFLALTTQNVSAAHFVTGFVNNASDGTSANGYEIIIWNPAIGTDDNLTDIIGTSGNSGTDNAYFIDCELLNKGCSVGDTINAKVLNNGSDYISELVSVNITGAGFDVFPDITLNSPPTISLNSPVNFANLSASQLTLSCTANDLDGNLANSTLYGNWSVGWHANETLSVSGFSNTTNFTKSLPEGDYQWSCLATDELSISKFADENFTFTLDTTPPIIESFALNLSGSVCGIQKTVRVNCTTTDSSTGIEKVLIQTISPSTSINHTAQLLSGNTYFSEILLNETGSWNFSCISQDFAQNTANSSTKTLSIHPNNSDLIVSSSDIVFSELNPIESHAVTINATIHNNGCTDANNFLVGFFEGDPDISAEQINGNQTVSVSSLGNTTTNITWSAKIGLTNIFVSADLENIISESNETNSKANKTINVNAWQELFGNVSIDKILANSGAQNLSIWLNQSSLTGNIFIADTESNIEWTKLQAFGKNSSGENTTNDFQEIDSLLSMTNFPDSVSNTFTSDGNSPVQTADFLIHQKNILQVPIINSTDNTNFITGILWDKSDDSNGEYDSSEKEDVIFAAKINKTSNGKFGTYDYEIRIPVRLREYIDTDPKDVFIYFDLN